jgi:hypothetical protein
LFSSGLVQADNLTSRRVTVSSSALGSISTNAAGLAVTAGTGGNGAQANHTFSFTFPQASVTVGSVKLKYCTTAFGGCTTPTGMDASTITSVASQTGWTGAPLIDTTTNLTSGDAECTGAVNGRANCIAFTRTGGAGSEAAGARTVGFGTGGATNWIKNPTSVGNYYVRITTYATAAYGTVVDTGNVMFSIATQVNITTKVQETLNFSVSASTVAPTSACTALSGTGNIFLGDPTNNVLDFTQAYDNHTYFRLSTNSANGATVKYSGDTLKSGTESIDVAGTAGPTPEASTVGAEQFGIGLDSADVAGGNGYSFTNLAAAAPYSTGNGTITNGGTATFYFDTTSMTTPINVATSSNVVICDTGSVRYIANISPNTAAGVYTTTITYIATPTY